MLPCTQGRAHRTRRAGRARLASRRSRSCSRSLPPRAHAGADEPIVGAGRRHAVRPGDAARVRRRSRSNTRRCTSTPGAIRCAVNPVLVQLLRGARSRPVAGAPDRRRQHRRDLVADARGDPARRHQLRADEGLAADHPGAGRRARREADHRRQPRGAAARARGGRGARDPPGDRHAATSKRSRSATSPTSTASFAWYRDRRGRVVFSRPRLVQLRRRT